MNINKATYKLAIHESFATLQELISLTDSVEIKLNDLDNEDSPENKQKIFDISNQFRQVVGDMFFQKRTDFKITMKYLEEIDTIYSSKAMLYFWKFVGAFAGSAFGVFIYFYFFR